jgi:hypothetical protein
MYGASRRPSWPMTIDVPTMRCFGEVDQDEDVLAPRGP